MPKMGLGASSSRLPLSGRIVLPINKTGLTLRQDFNTGAVVPISDGAASFNGSSEYVNCGVIDFDTSDISISFWFIANTIGAYEGLVSNRDSSGTKPGIQIRFDDGADDIELFTDYGGGAFSTKTGSFVPSVNVWTHVAASIDRSGSQSLYINGILEASTDISAQASADLTNADALRIGRSEGSHYFDGNICNVGIFSAVLTQAQIKSIMYKNYAGLTTSEKTNLVSWWNLSNVLRGAIDSHGSNNGTLT